MSPAGGPTAITCLDSLVVFAEIADTLRAAPRDEAQVTLARRGPVRRRSRPLRPNLRDNLVMRAADELMAAFPKKPIRGVRLDLTKRLPVAAGLGGGSADAAAALRLLDRLWGFGASRETLAAIGLAPRRRRPGLPRLASRCKAEGIGEKSSARSGIPELPMILVNPGIALPTRNVFRRLHPDERTPMWPVPPGFKSLIEFAQWLRLSRNDLFEPAKEEAKVVGTVAQGASRPIPSACSRACRGRAPRSSASSIRTPPPSGPPPASTPPDPPGGWR